MTRSRTLRARPWRRCRWSNLRRRWKWLSRTWVPGARCEFIWARPRRSPTSRRSEGASPRPRRPRDSRRDAGATIAGMRRFLLIFSFFSFFLSVAALAPTGPRVQISHTGESLRGVSAVSRQVSWASGTHGTYLRTIDGGRTWTAAQVPYAGALDFRAVVTFSADEAFLMSAGPGEQSRIYYTSDAGKHWQLQFKNTNPKGFFDSMVFWDAKHGVVLGDPIPDEAGKLKFELLLTEDGESWKPISG